MLEPSSQRQPQRAIGVLYPLTIKHAGSSNRLLGGSSSHVAHHQHGAMGMADHAARDGAQEVIGQSARIM